MLKYLIVARHADAQRGFDGGLTDAGRAEAEKLALAISRIVGSKSKIRILSSPVKRVMMTAKYIAHEWGDATGEMVEKRDDLADGTGSERSVSFLLRGLYDFEKDSSAIVVTHEPFTAWPPFYFMRDVLGVKDGLPDPKALSTGHAWVVDCQTKTIHRLPG